MIKSSVYEECFLGGTHYVPLASIGFTEKVRALLRSNAAKGLTSRDWGLPASGKSEGRS